MATSTVVASDNSAQEKELSKLKRIKTERNFANQAYANFKRIKFGIDSCCYTDFVSATVNKDLCDWQNAASNKVVVASGISVGPSITLTSYSPKPNFLIRFGK